MKYKIEKLNDRYYLYTKEWWFPVWISEHHWLYLNPPIPFASIEAAEKYLKQYYINKPEIVKEGEI